VPEDVRVDVPPDAGGPWAPIPAALHYLS